MPEATDISTSLDSATQIVAASNEAKRGFKRQVSDIVTALDRTSDDLKLGTRINVWGNTEMELALKAGFNENDKCIGIMSNFGSSTDIPVPGLDNSSAYRLVWGNKADGPAMALIVLQPYKDKPRENFRTLIPVDSDDRMGVAAAVIERALSEKMSKIEAPKSDRARKLAEALKSV